MSDPVRSNRQNLLPPPPPPLPPARPGAWQRLVGPLGFGQSSQSRPPSAQANRPGLGNQNEPVRIESFVPLPSRTATHRTGIPITALDINEHKTHAVLAGQDILKTILVADDGIGEDVNIRSTVNAASHTSGRRQCLPASDVKWSHGKYGHIIATAAVNGPIVLYNVARGAELSSLNEHRNQVHKLAFNPHAGCLLLSGSQDGKVKMWDFRVNMNDGRIASTMKSSKEFPGRVGAVRDVRWSPTDIEYFITGSDNGVIQKWDVRNLTGPVLRINGHQKPCVSIDWHPDGQYVVSGGFDKYVRVWDFKGGKQRQKPSFELRTPQSIANVRWRPACWSAELAGTGNWQSTQLITSYTQDDPRLHVWDLRRPHLPFRELDRYNRPANDLLWASKDLLWTVGNEGMFTQTDISHAPQPHNELPPCAISWCPDGECISFSEDRTQRRESGREDPAVGFLSVNHEKLSSGEDGSLSRSLTDDESGFDGLFSSTSKRRQSKAVSTRSVKSQASTPPSIDGMRDVLTLDKAVFQRKDLFNNKQIGMSGSILGVTMEPEVVKHLANSYAQASTERERRRSPDHILQRLEDVFSSNADACDFMSLHRTAQSWRILGAVIIPELKLWADKNRSERLKLAQEQLRSLPSTREGLDYSEVRKVGETSPRTPDRIVRSQKVLSNLFKGIMESGKSETGLEMDSTSNMTTPLARPLPDSPLSDTNQHGQRFQHLDEAMETMPPLPPSVLSSHSAAAMASRALLENSSTKSETPPSSPENQRQTELETTRQKMTHIIDPVLAPHNPLLSPKAVTQPVKSPISEATTQRQRTPQPQRQEDRRAALRDYRAQTRPLLTFDRALESPEGGAIYVQRHDSADSFPMFSASTDSSHKGRSIDGSFNSPDVSFRAPLTPDAWHDSHGSDDFEPSSPPSDESGKSGNFAQRLKTSNDVDPSQSGRPGSPSFDFRLGGQSEPIEDTSHSIWIEEEQHGKITRDLSNPTMSVSPSSAEQFNLKQTRPFPAPRIHSVNPLLSRSETDVGNAVEDEPQLSDSYPYQEEDIMSKDYVYSDFRPIDYSRYKPEFPFAWSSLPLICHAISFDLSTGPACGQFSANLLMHVYPFFFHHFVVNNPSIHHGQVASVSDRLMEPGTSHRLIENIFLTYSVYLKRFGLFVPLAELRLVCRDFECPSLYAEEGVQKAKGDGLNHGDPYLVSATCTKCRAPITQGKNLCSRCKSNRDVCPVCLSLQPNPTQTRFPSAGIMERTDDEDSDQTQSSQAMWTVCHTCGHGGHFTCMVEWLAHPFSQGACPSLGCGCDCGPGLVRRQRIEKQVYDNELRLLQGSSAPSLKKDTKHAEPSPAVQKTRHLLRDGERGTQSGDERGVLSRRGSSGRGGFAGQSQRKSVRVLTPGEQQAGEHG